MSRTIPAALGLVGPMLAAGLCQALTIGVVIEGESDAAAGPSRTVDWELPADADGILTVFVVIDPERGESTRLSVSGYQFELIFTPGLATAVARTTLAPSPLVPNLFGPPAIDLPAGSVSQVNAASFSGGVDEPFRTERFDLSGLEVGDAVVIDVLVEDGDTILIDPAGNCSTDRVGDACDSFASYGVTVNVVPEPGEAPSLVAALAALLLVRRWAARPFSGV